MILSELIPFLNSLGAKPKKRLSQNFLVDPNIVRKIVETAEITASDRVLEIGPGPGALTVEILKKGASVYAVEMDPLFAEQLHRLQTPDQRLSVFSADFLDFPLGSLPSPLKVVANLPYHITSPILEKLCKHASSFSSLTLMVQKEVAERMVASPGTKQFSSFTLFLQFYTQIQRTFGVSASCFYPKPKIDSAVVRFDFHETPSVDPDRFFSFVRKAFQQRRKMISRSLKNPSIKTALLSMGENPDARPEDLSLEKWLELYRKQE